MTFARAEPASRNRGLLWVALGATLWGADTFFRRPLASSLSSPRIVLYEHLILTAVLIAVAWRARGQWRALTWRQWGAVLWISWGGSALGTLCFTEAVRIGNPTTAVLLQKTQPVFTALLAGMLLGERLGRRFWMCLAAALCAVYLVSFGATSPVAPMALVQVKAALLALGAAALWGCSTVLGRFALRSLSFPVLTALRIVLATPLLSVLALGAPARAPDARQVFSLILLALVPGLLALLIYYRGLSQATASRAAIAELSFPASAALINWLSFGARISAAQLAGFILLWGIILLLAERRGGES